MADSLNMNGLSLNDSKHGPPAGMGGGRSTYIPPHLRSSMRGPAPVNNFDGAGAGPTPAGAAAAAAQGLNGSAWANNT